MAVRIENGTYYMTSPRQSHNKQLRLLLMQFTNSLTRQSQHTYCLNSPHLRRRPWFPCCCHGSNGGAKKTAARRDKTWLNKVFNINCNHTHGCPTTSSHKLVICLLVRACKTNLNETYDLASCKITSQIFCNKPNFGKVFQLTLGLYMFSWWVKEKWNN